jgi:hypothetical protein
MELLRGVHHLLVVVIRSEISVSKFTHARYDTEIFI